MKKEPIILASKSPRRRELFSLVTDEYECIDSGADESCADRSAGGKKLSLELAQLKCAAVAQQNPNRTVVGCDTVVQLDDGEILGKPHSRDEALHMLHRLSGATHSVFTGVYITCADGRTSSLSCETRVSFYPISDDEICAYVDTEEPYDKAGGYGAQGVAARFISGIDGDFFNVVGLPVSKIYRELMRLDVL